VLNRSITILGNVFYHFGVLTIQKRRFLNNLEVIPKPKFCFPGHWFDSNIFDSYQSSSGNFWIESHTLDSYHCFILVFFLALWIDSRISSSHQILIASYFPLFTCPNWIKFLLSRITTLFLPKTLHILPFLYEYSNTNDMVKNHRMKAIKELVFNVS